MAVEVLADPFAPGMGGFMVALEVSVESSLCDGIYSIPFTVTDPDGNSGQAALTVHVRGNGAPQCFPSHPYGETTVTLTPSGVVKGPPTRGRVEIWDPGAAG
ncbi:MAG: hypothetical protein ACUVQS_06920 [Candidatus Bipolaricaulaceae bacterium]